MMMFIVRLTGSYRIQTDYKANTCTFLSEEDLDK